MRSIAHIAHINVDLPGSLAASVVTNNSFGASELTRYLIRTSHPPKYKSDAHFIGGNKSDFNTTVRIRAFQDVLWSELEHAPDSDQINTYGYGPGAAEKATRAADGLVLLDSSTTHRQTEAANTLFTNMFTAHPEIHGVMAANDSMAVGVVKALEAAGRTDIPVVGFDNIPAVGPMFADGRMFATVDQFGQQMAANAIDKALQVLTGGPKLEGWIKTDVKLVTAN